MRQTDTKQRIFNAAAKLFAQKGYSDTTIRDIAEEVGIRGAALYNHYASKEDILNDILDLYEERSSFYQQELDELNLDEIPVEEYPLRMHFFYKPEELMFMSWAGRIVMNEQFTNPRAAELLLGKLFENYISSYERFFETLVSRKLFNGDNCRIYAEILAYVSMTFMMQFQHLEMFDAKELSDRMDEIYKFIYTLEPKNRD